MPRLPLQRIRRPRLAYLFTSLFLVGLLVVGVGVGYARTLNGVQLDDGTCGHNLQLGSDKTASSSEVYVYFKHEEAGIGTEFAQQLIKHLAE